MTSGTYLGNAGEVRPSFRDLHKERADELRGELSELDSALVGLEEILLGPKEVVVPPDKVPAQRNEILGLLNQYDDLMITSTSRLRSVNLRLQTLIKRIS